MRTPIISPSRRARPPAITPEPLGPGDNLRGAGLMCVAMAAFTCNDTAMKFVAQDLPLYQSITLRGVVVLVGLWLLAARKGGLRLTVPRADYGLLSLRTIGEVASTVLFLNALRVMPIADLSAIMQSLPLMVMLAAAVVFGESLGWRRLLAVGVGLVGVLMILRPGSGTFGIWSLVALGSVAGVVLRDLATRRFSRAVTSTTIAFYAALSVTLSAAVMSIWEGWQMPEPLHILLLVLAGAFITIGYLAAVATMRVGEISYVAPFRYTSLIWAIVLGLLVFGEMPDLWTWAGSALVVSAGIYSIWREAALKRRQRA
ncbi:DMT family transporter [Paracoccus tegillarcae]|uniref:EamA/RhaT family transporter n=1 Tax=Paracoccus tegillarcae TaxID=1529068 RepID=A0A2K9EFG5_9RHOB|nr:DMT family transporter [Paracoccus tegillarcae]AUH33698.1 EamA/RhaT family transporter [Paracoccus tegillarcae]